MKRTRETTAIAWLAGDPAVRATLERVLAAGLDESTCIHRTKQRAVHRIVLPGDTGDAGDAGDAGEASGLGLAVKIHSGTSGAHRLREGLKHRLGRSPAAREWHGLAALRTAGVEAPTPRAWGRLASGQEIVVSDFVAARPLAEAFAGASGPERTALVEALARAIAGLHTADLRHGDLHLGNLALRDDRIVFFDLQRTRRSHGSSSRLADLARLELSLARNGWSAEWRQRLRARLAPAGDFDAALVRFLQDHLRGRARRRLRPGRQWAVVRVDRRHGLRDSTLEPESLARLLAVVDEQSQAQASHARRGGRTRVFEVTVAGRSWVVKQSEAGSARRALADRLRGSPAARGFRAGQRFALLGAPVARPLAFVEQTRLGLPRRSWLVLEAVGSQDLDRVTPETPERARQLACDLAGWLAELHAWGLGHRDLKAGNLRWAREAGSNRFWLIDLEDLVGPRRLSGAERTRALAQLNASLEDARFDIETRLAALARYLERLPLAAPAEVAAAEIARLSLARGHRWVGRGCTSERVEQP